MRFQHNDMEHLEARLAAVPRNSSKLVIADAVFSMDGDIIDLPKIVELCKKYGAWLMIDEAHSVGVLGATGRGIEEYFGMQDVIDINHFQNLQDRLNEINCFPSSIIDNDGKPGERSISVACMPHSSNQAAHDMPGGKRPTDSCRAIIV